MGNATARRQQGAATRDVLGSTADFIESCPMDKLDEIEDVFVRHQQGIISKKEPDKPSLITDKELKRLKFILDNEAEREVFMRAIAAKRNNPDHAKTEEPSPYENLKQFVKVSNDAGKDISDSNKDSHPKVSRASVPNARGEETKTDPGISSLAQSQQVKISFTDSSIVYEITEQAETAESVKEISPQNIDDVGTNQFGLNDNDENRADRKSAASKPNQSNAFLDIVNEFISRNDSDALLHYLRENDIGYKDYQDLNTNLMPYGVPVGFVRKLWRYLDDNIIVIPIGSFPAIPTKYGEYINSAIDDDDDDAKSKVDDDHFEDGQDINIEEQHSDELDDETVLFGITSVRNTDNESNKGLYPEASRPSSAQSQPVGGSHVIHEDIVEPSVDAAPPSIPTKEAIKSQNFSTIPPHQSELRKEANIFIPRKRKVSIAPSIETIVEVDDEQKGNDDPDTASLDESQQVDDSSTHSNMVQQPPKGRKSEDLQNKVDDAKAIQFTLKLQIFEGMDNITSSNNGNINTFTNSHHNNNQQTILQTASGFNINMQQSSVPQPPSFALYPTNNNSTPNRVHQRSSASKPNESQQVNISSTDSSIVQQPLNGHGNIEQHRRSKVLENKDNDDHETEQQDETGQLLRLSPLNGMNDDNEAEEKYGMKHANNNHGRYPQQYNHHRYPQQLAYHQYAFSFHHPPLLQPTPIYQQWTSTHTPFLAKDPNNPRKGNFYTSPEMLQKIADSSLETFITYTVYNDLGLLLDYIKGSISMQINDGQIKVVDAHDGPKAIINPDLHFKNGQDMYLIAVLQNEQDFREHGVRWKNVYLMTEQQLNCMGIGYYDLPKSSRNMSWFKRGLASPPRNMMIHEITEMLQYTHLASKKYRIKGRNKSNHTDDNQRKIEIKESVLRKRGQEALYHQILRPIPTVVIKGKYQWIEFHQITGIYDVNRNTAWLTIALSYDEWEQRWNVEVIDDDGGVVYYRHRLVALSPNDPRSYTYNEIQSWLGGTSVQISRD